MELQDAQKLAEEIIAQHGLDQKGWSFEFDGGHRRFGRCYYATRRITLSRHLTMLNDRYQVHLTIVHEVAHAIAGHEAGHGPEWVRICRLIGGDGKRCFSAAEVNMAPRYVKVEF